MSIKSNKVHPRNLEEAKKILTQLGCSPQGVEIMSRKMLPLYIKLSGLLAGSVNILKQEALAIGIDVATHKMVVTGQIKRSDVIIIGNQQKVFQLLKKLEAQKSILEFAQIIEQIKLYL